MLSNYYVIQNYEGINNIDTTFYFTNFQQIILNRQHILINHYQLLPLNHHKKWKYITAFNVLNNSDLSFTFDMVHVAYHFHYKHYVTFLTTADYSENDKYVPHQI